MRSKPRVHSRSLPSRLCCRDQYPTTMSSYLGSRAGIVALAYEPDARLSYLDSDGPGQSNCQVDRNHSRETSGIDHRQAGGVAGPGMIARRRRRDSGPRRSCLGRTCQEGLDEPLHFVGFDGPDRAIEHRANMANTLQSIYFVKVLISFARRHDIPQFAQLCSHLGFVGRSKDKVPFARRQAKRDRKSVV